MFKITDKDNGAQGLLRRMGATKRSSVDVGVLGAKAGSLESPGVTTVDVASWAEFGIGQPRRSWLGDWVDANHATVQTLQRKALAAIAKGMPVAQALELVGLSIAGKLQERIANTPANWEKNADSTIKRKGSSKPLVDTGQFRSSISPRVVVK